jgi:hypothetical protein
LVWLDCDDPAAVVSVVSKEAQGKASHPPAENKAPPRIGV